MENNSKLKVLLLEGIHEVAKENLEKNGFEVHMEKKALSESELIKTLPDYDIVGIRSKTKITAEVIRSCPKLKAIGAFCIGTNQIDLDFAKEMGVVVFNAPHSNTRSVAELVIGEIIMLSRKVFEKSSRLHSGVWDKSATNCFEVRRKTLGIIGYGNIGGQLSVIAEALGMKVLYYDIKKKLPLGNAKSAKSMEEVLSSSDFVSLHVPDTSITKGMISSKELSLMKKGSVLINASRGEVVSIKDLAESIKTGHLGGAAIDVFPYEPSSNSETFISELQNLPNVILTPHIGGSTEEAQEAIGIEVSNSFIKLMFNGDKEGQILP